jgi:hypothetical protein
MSEIRAFSFAEDFFQKIRQQVLNNNPDGNFSVQDVQQALDAELPDDFDLSGFLKVPSDSIFLSNLQSAYGGEDGRINKSDELARAMFPSITGKGIDEKVNVMASLFPSLSTEVPSLTAKLGGGLQSLQEIEKALPSQTERDAFAKQLLGPKGTWEQLKSIAGGLAAGDTNKKENASKELKTLAKDAGIDAKAIEAMSPEELLQYIMILAGDRKLRDEANRAQNRTTPVATDPSGYSRGTRSESGGANLNSGGGPGNPNVQPSNIPAKPVSLTASEKEVADSIEKKLAGKPLAQYAGHIVKKAKEAEQKIGVPWQQLAHVFAAIGMHETGGGTLGVGLRKVFGIGAYDSNPDGAAYAGIDSQLDALVKTFQSNAERGGWTGKGELPQLLEAVNRGGWATDSQWHAKVLNHYNQLAA